jgi:hypothetical protein
MRMMNINLDIVSKEQITNWIWYGILHHSWDRKITDAILLDINVSEDDEEKYDFTLEVLSKVSEVYFKLGIEIANLI